MTIQSLQIKIHAYEEESNSLIVSFGCDELARPIDEQPKMAFQPTMFEETDVSKVLQKIAQSGVSIVEQQIKQEQLSQNVIAIEEYKAKIGETLTYVVADLYQGEQLTDGTEPVI